MKNRKEKNQRSQTIKKEQSRFGEISSCCVWGVQESAGKKKRKKRERKSRKNPHKGKKPKQKGKNPKQMRKKIIQIGKKPQINE